MDGASGEVWRRWRASYLGKRERLTPLATANIRRIVGGSSQHFPVRGRTPGLSVAVRTARSASRAAFQRSMGDVISLMERRARRAPAAVPATPEPAVRGPGRPARDVLLRPRLAVDVPRGRARGAHAAGRTLAARDRRDPAGRPHRPRPARRRAPRRGRAPGRGTAPAARLARGLADRRGRPRCGSRRMAAERGPGRAVRPRRRAPRVLRRLRPRRPRGHRRGRRRGRPRARRRARRGGRDPARRRDGARRDAPAPPRRRRAARGRRRAPPVRRRGTAGRGGGRRVRGAGARPRGAPPDRGDAVRAAPGRDRRAQWRRCSARSCDTCSTGSASATRASCSRRSSRCRSSSCSWASGCSTSTSSSSSAQFWRILAVTEAAIAIEIGAALWVAFRLVRPADPWLRGERTPETAIAAWRALAGLPLRPHPLRARAADRAQRRADRGVPRARARGPVRPGGPRPRRRASASWSRTRCSCASSRSSSRCARWSSASRATSRTASDLGRATVPLRWRLLVGLPVINVITGVAVVGLAHGQPEPAHARRRRARRRSASRSRSRSSCRSCCCARSWGRSRTCRRGTARVAAGRLQRPRPGRRQRRDRAVWPARSTRWSPACEERERSCARRSGRSSTPASPTASSPRGTSLEGEEVEVTVLFVDIRDFTRFAERSSAREVVAELNRFYDYVVPLLGHHGGHANKFVGDGLLGVFGAPDRRPDHADRAIDAALQIAEVVGEAYEGDLDIGIGINSGTGRLGHRRRRRARSSSR